LFRENAKAFFQFAFAKIFFAAANFIFAVAYIVRPIVDANRSFAVLRMTLGQEYKGGEF